MYNYTVIEGEKHPLFIFNTDHEYQVSLSFYPVKQLKYFETIPTIYNIDIDSYCKGTNSLRKKDLKIGITVAHILGNYVKENPETLITYLCDDGDSKHYARFKKFKGWANIYPNENVKVLNFEFKKEKKNKTYLTGVIFNPHFYSTTLIETISKGQLDVIINK